MGKRIFLYGEYHAVPVIHEAELEAWEKFYASGMRHLFIEHGYCSAQVLNEWMRSDSDELLMLWYDNLDGTLAHAECTLDFYRELKARFPKTVLHGVDVRRVCSI